MTNLRRNILDAIAQMAEAGFSPVLVAFMNPRGHVRMIAVDGLPVASFLRTLSADPAPRLLRSGIGREDA
jgi:hypothetical protein